MEAWLALPFTTKLLDIVLILATMGVAGGFILFFIKVLREITKSADGEIPPVKLGPIELGGKGESESGGSTQVVVNVGQKEEASTSLAQLGYRPPKGVLPFTQHKYFRVMDEAIEGRFVELKSRHPKSQYAYLKNKAFSHFLFRCKAKMFRDMIADFVDDVLETNGDFTVLSSIKKRTERAMRQYEELARTTHVQITEKEFLLRIPELMIIKFNDWHQPHVSLTMDRLDHILDSQFYPSWQLKLISILDTFEIIFRVTFDYAEYSLMDLNGDLDEALLKELMEKKECL